MTTYGTSDWMRRAAEDWGKVAFAAVCCRACFLAGRSTCLPKPTYVEAIEAHGLASVLGPEHVSANLSTIIEAGTPA